MASELATLYSVLWLIAGAAFSILTIALATITAFIPLACAYLYRHAKSKNRQTRTTPPKPSWLSLSSIPAMFSRSFSLEEYAKRISEPTKRAALLEVTRTMSALTRQMNAPETAADYPQEYRMPFCMRQLDFQLEKSGIAHTAEAVEYRKRAAALMAREGICY